MGAAIARSPSAWSSGLDASRPYGEVSASLRATGPVDTRLARARARRPRPRDGLDQGARLRELRRGLQRDAGVINGFSDLILELWGDAGRHARSAIGAGELPFGMPVEVEAVVALA